MYAFYQPSYVASLKSKNSELYNNHCQSSMIWSYYYNMLVQTLFMISSIFTVNIIICCQKM